LEDLSLHILDVAENAIRAEARHVSIRIREDLERDLLEFEVEDDGEGMSPEMVEHAMDPFVTTRETRRVGLGLPLLLDAAQMAGGAVELSSTPGKGTRVVATFQHGHIDRKPLGDMGSTIMSLVMSNPDGEWVYEHRRDGQVFHFDTGEIRQALSPVPLNRPEVLKWIQEYVNEGLRHIRAGEPAANV
jgi:anti-sigma regulatory factor (Ser/Thr protein kinase)